MKKNYIYAILTVVIWATMATAVKLLLADIPNLQALSVSSGFAFAFMLIVNILTGKIHLMKKYCALDFAKMSGLGFLGLFLYSALYYYGISVLTSQEACILNYLWPIMLLVFSCLILKEPVTARKILAMICSFVGIIILTLGSGAAGSGNQAAGIFACIAAAVCYGLFSVLNKKADFDQNITMMIIWLTVAVCAGILGKNTEQWVAIEGVQWIGILWLGVVIDAVAYLTWALALNSAENTARIANLAYLTPFLSVVISAVCLGEEVKVNAVVALVFIVGGILVQSLEKQGFPENKGN